MKIFFVAVLLCSHFILFSQTDSVKPLVYTFAEQMPQFPGREKEIFRFLQKNSNYSVDTTFIYKNKKVFTRFVVETDGTTSDIKIMKGFSPELDSESVRLVKMLRFIPGKQMGKPVRVYYSLPICFQ